MSNLNMPTFHHGQHSQVVQSIFTNVLHNVTIEPVEEAMNNIGQHIEARRRQRGLSRLQLALRLGVSSQTVLNLERDPTYNLGVSLLRRLEEALQVIFHITMKEETMSTSIQMGNDEFILYIRKNYRNCATSNVDLGRRIWAWIKERDATATQVDDGKSVSCFWGDRGPHIGETKLPKTATQFQFEPSLLPALYDHLDALGTV
jgi:transcriptional regulator with XRE-family HTH domain